MFVVVRTIVDRFTCILCMQGDLYGRNPTGIFADKEAQVIIRYTHMYRNGQ